MRQLLGHQAGLSVVDGLTTDLMGDPVSGGEVDVVLRTEMRFGLGFSKPSSKWRFGTDGRAYGTPGAGGSFGVADPATKVGFVYAPNALGLRLWDDPREAVLRNAVYAAAMA